jgi:hypothetical protein
MFSTIQYWMSEGKAVITRVENISFLLNLKFKCSFNKIKKVILTS